MTQKSALVRGLLLAVGLVVVACGVVRGETLQTKQTSLKEAYKDDFLVGVALGGMLPKDYSPEELAVIKSHFNAVTPENCMKPESLQPKEGEWNFDMADALVKFAEENNLQIFGHTLVWHNQTPKWFFEENGKPVSREKALERMKTHIQTVMGRYKGKIKGWDVVNEAAPRGGKVGTDLNDSPWHKAIGDDYVIKAYQFAHEADPSAELQYNEFEFETGAKHKNTLNIVKQLLDAGIPLKAVGIQAHYKLDHVPFEGLEKTIEEIKALGLQVMITELDLDITRRVDFGDDPTKIKAEDAASAEKSTPEEYKRQAEQYAKLFEIFHRHKDAISRVTFWGFNDDRSWLVYTPRGRKTPGAPLLFEGNMNPKPALQAVLDVVAKPGS